MNALHVINLKKYLFIILFLSSAAAFSQNTNSAMMASGFINTASQQQNKMQAIGVVGQAFVMSDKVYACNNTYTGRQNSDGNTTSTAASISFTNINIKFGPDPVQDYMDIFVSTNTNSTLPTFRIKVYNNLGQQVATSQTDGVYFSDNFRLNTQDLQANAFYIAELVSTNGTIKKVIKFTKSN